MLKIYIPGTEYIFYDFTKVGFCFICLLSLGQFIKRHFFKCLIKYNLDFQLAQAGVLTCRYDKIASGNFDNLCPIATKIES